MSRNVTVNCPAGEWTELTNAENCSTDMTVVLKSWNTPALIQATTSGTAPSTVDGLPLLEYGNGFKESTLAEIFTGLASPVRLWGRPLETNPYTGLNADSVDIYVSYTND